MEEGYLQKLRKTRTSLVSDLTPDLISDVLFEKGVINQDELDTISNNMLTTADRNRKLLNIISSKGPNGFHVFRDALSSDFPWLQKQLDDTLVDTAALSADSTTNQKPASFDDITDEMMSRVVINIMSSGSHSRWKFVGRALLVPESTLSDIEYKNPRDLRAQIYDMLNLWRKELVNKSEYSAGNSAVDTLRQALIKEGMNLTADVIESMRPLKVKAEPDIAEAKGGCSSSNIL